ncbi:MAG: hypothetical protein HY547_04050 [Elusimicrobia bacterium]|nr:hypothetical protein [Elusimicrobiota bacterium]
MDSACLSVWPIFSGCGAGNNDTDTPEAFVPIKHPTNQAWAWVQDPRLVIFLSGPEDENLGYTRGLYPKYGSEMLALWGERTWLDGFGWIPLVITVARGNDPVILNDGESLTLALEGSTEHGCPSNQMEAKITPQKEGRDIEMTLEISGIPYFAIPTNGQLTIYSDAPPLEIEAQDIPVDGSLEFSNFQGLEAKTLDGATLKLPPKSPFRGSNCSPTSAPPSLRLTWTIPANRASPAQISPLRLAFTRRPNDQNFNDGSTR